MQLASKMRFISAQYLAYFENDLWKIKKMINEIEEQIRKLGKKEIKSSVIGEITMRKLKKVDNIAYIRFASVYRQFKDIKDFKQEIRGL